MTCIYFGRQICETQVTHVYRIIKTRSCSILSLTFISQKIFFKITKPKEQQRQQSVQIISSISNNELTFKLCHSDSCNVCNIAFHGGDIKKLLSSFQKVAVQLQQGKLPSHLRVWLFHYLLYAPLKVTFRWILNHLNLHSLKKQNEMKTPVAQGMQSSQHIFTAPQQRGIKEEGICTEKLMEIYFQSLPKKFTQRDWLIASKKPSEY